MRGARKRKNHGTSHRKYSFFKSEPGVSGKYGGVKSVYKGSLSEVITASSSGKHEISAANETHPSEGIKAEDDSYTDDLRTKNCQRLKNIKSGNVSIGMQEEIAVALYKCYDGYHIRGNRFRKCKGDGKWSGKDPACVGKLIFFLV